MLANEALASKHIREMRFPWRLIWGYITVWGWEGGSDEVLVAG